MTITTPAGHKVRSQSRRRFIVVIDYVNPGKPSEARIEQRTDDLDTARKTVTARTFFGTDGRASKPSIFDSKSGGFVR